jgi:hypothetical protein
VTGHTVIDQEFIDKIGARPRRSGPIGATHSRQDVAVMQEWRCELLA